MILECFEKLYNKIVTFIIEDDDYDCCVDDESFIDKCIKNTAFIDEIELYEEMFYSQQSYKSLREFLGLRESEYHQWLINPDTLKDIIDNRILNTIQRIHYK